MSLKVLESVNESSEPTEAILTLAGGTSDEFAARMAGWLADIAMNAQRTP